MSENLENYYTIDNMLDSLDKIEPIDLTDENTDKQTILNFSKDVLSILSKYSKLIKYADNEDVHAIISSLKGIGCIPHEGINEKLFDKSIKMGQAITQKDSITFPLEVFRQLGHVNNRSNFAIVVDKALSGNEHSWVNQWLNAQDMDKENFETIDDILEALDKIEPIDLTDENTDKQTILNFSKDVLSILSKSSEILKYAENEDVHAVLTSLKGIGCIPHEGINEKLFDKSIKMGQAITQKDSIAFPLEVFRQLGYVNNRSNFAIVVDKALSGNEHSWVNQWLNAQAPTKNGPTITNANASLAR